MLSLFFLPLLIAQISGSCSDISFSECDDLRSSSGILLAIQVAGEQNCKEICQALGEGCKFFTFEKESYFANCQLYKQQLSTFLNHCNVLSGPKSFDGPLCDYDKVEGFSVLEGHCDYGTIEERFGTSRWEYCQKQCTALDSCNNWRYLKEEATCHILGHSDKSCEFKIGLNTPEEEDQGCNCGEDSAVNGTCYEVGSPRLFEHVVLINNDISSKKNTPTVCKINCYNQGYSYAGVQAGTQCWCGNVKPPVSKIRDSSECNTNCPGDASEKCGASWRMNIYKAGP